MPSLCDEYLCCGELEHQYVGAALKVAEASVYVAASTALPLAGPLVESVGGWATLDQWACHGLDRIQEAAPIITKPTHEVVNRTREALLCKLAGAGAGTEVGSDEDQQQLIPHQPPSPSSLTHALTTRAFNLTMMVAESKGVMMVTTAVHSLVDTAHAITDFYLPPEKDDLFLNHAKVPVEVVGVKMEGLIGKWRRRLKLRVCALLQVTHNSPCVNPDDFVITTGHLVELSRRLVSRWYQVALRYPYLGCVVQSAGHLGTTMLDTAITTQSAFLSTVARMHQATIASPVGPIVVAGVDGVRYHVRLLFGATKNSVGFVVNGMVTGGVETCGVVRDGVNVTYTAGRESLGIVRSVVKNGVTTVLSLVQMGTHMVGGITNNALKVSLVMTNSIRRNGALTVQTIVKTPTDISSSIVTNCRQSTKAVLTTLQNIAPGLYTGMASVTKPGLFGTIKIGQPIIVQIRSMTENVMVKIKRITEKVIIRVVRVKSVTEEPLSNVLRVGYGALQTLGLTAAVHNITTAFGSVFSASHVAPQAVQVLLKQLHGVLVTHLAPHIHSQEDALAVVNQIYSTDHVNSSYHVNSRDHINSREHAYCTDCLNSLDHVNSADSYPDDMNATDSIETSLLIPALDSQVQGSWSCDSDHMEGTGNESETETEAEMEEHISDDGY
ncbi:hypothetical protein Pmani_004987 [Petrolisthes manimaculis]|uniref:Uncharacterized protein n=1 Tax=Petrolisthes manimaculis TaxID=1843537 RepID=A0AAE1QCL8_9EUCA|nr:hypothetical protein Pmani_004987 [Petrolisthes manimaculis]